jgi:hypothetical protein
MNSSLTSLRAYRLRSLYRYYRSIFTGPQVPARYAYALAVAKLAD